MLSRECVFSPFPHRQSFFVTLISFSNAWFDVFRKMKLALGASTVFEIYGSVLFSSTFLSPIFGTHLPLLNIVLPRSPTPQAPHKTSSVFFFLLFVAWPFLSVFGYGARTIFFPGRRVLSLFCEKIHSVFLGL